MELNFLMKVFLFESSPSAVCLHTMSTSFIEFICSHAATVTPLQSQRYQRVSGTQQVQCGAQKKLKQIKTTEKASTLTLL